MRTSLYWKLWWDKGILWIMYLPTNETLNVNSYQAQELLIVLGEEKQQIDAQAVIDEREFGRDKD